MKRFNIPPDCINWPLRKIAKTFGCSVPTASRHRQKLGNVKARLKRQIKWREIDWENESTSSLAQRFGMYMSTISRKRAELAPETLVRFKKNRK